MQPHPAKIELEWGISQTPFGNILIASSPKGIAHLSFFETNEADSYQQLTHDFPTATHKRNDRFVADLARQIYQAKSATQLKLDLHGTEFQLQVWKALLEIPSGKTTTYSQLAKRIGKPSANLQYQREGEAKRATSVAVDNHAQALEMVCERLLDPQQGVLKALSEVEAIGHRVVHGGEQFCEPTRVDAAVKRGITECAVPIKATCDSIPAPSTSTQILPFHFR